MTSISSRAIAARSKRKKPMSAKKFTQMRNQAREKARAERLKAAERVRRAGQAAKAPEVKQEVKKQAGKRGATIEGSKAGKQDVRTMSILDRQEDEFRNLLAPAKRAEKQKVKDGKKSKYSDYLILREKIIPEGMTKAAAQKRARENVKAVSKKVEENKMKTTKKQVGGALAKTGAKKAAKKAAPKKKVRQEAIMDRILKGMSAKERKEFLESMGFQNKQMMRSYFEKGGKLKTKGDKSGDGLLDVLLEGKMARMEKALERKRKFKGKKLKKKETKGGDLFGKLSTLGYQRGTMPGETFKAGGKVKSKGYKAGGKMSSKPRGVGAATRGFGKAMK